MLKFSTLILIVKKPTILFVILGGRKFLNWLPDKTYLKILYRFETGKKLNLEKPRYFNEKLQWLKLYDRNPIYTKLVDKYEVKNLIIEKLGAEYLIPMIAVYERVEDIEWEKLPNQFVVKCTHGSGSNIICKEKENLSIEKSNKKLNKWMKKNWYWSGREWPYKYVKPRIIIEKYIVDDSNEELKDFKFHCFNGEPFILQVDYNRFIKHYRNIYDLNYNQINATIQYPSSNSLIIAKPTNLDKMIEIAKILSEGFKYIRVDLYESQGKVYFGELTLHHGSGLEKIIPESFDKTLSDLIKLDQKPNSSLS